MYGDPGALFFEMRVHRRLHESKPQIDDNKPFSRLCLENTRSAGFQPASADVYILSVPLSGALPLVQTLRD